MRQSCLVSNASRVKDLLDNGIKRKATSLYNARLCARGDWMRPDVPMGYDSPTVSRCAPNLAICIGCQTQWACGAVDISSSFTQSALMPRKERIITIAPPYIELPGPNRVDPKFVRPSPPKFGLFTLRPLCGDSCAPLRWFATTRASFKDGKWQQMESATCVCRLVGGGKWRGVAAIRVDDILCVGNGVDWAALQKIIDFYGHTPIEYHTSTNQSVYIGLDVGLRPDGCSFICQA